MIENTEQVAHTAYAVTSVVLLLTCARFFLRRLKHERIYPDDWLMIGAFLLMGGFASTFPVLLQTGSGKHAHSDIETVEETEFDSKYIMFGRIAYLSYIWSLKACILLYYYRLTTRQPEQRYVIFTFYLIATTWTTTFLLWMLQCHPFNLNWKFTNPPQKCARVGLLFMAISIIVTNVILVIIPLPMIWRTQMVTATKLKVSAVFLVGIFLVVISIIRTILQESKIQQIDDRFFWGNMECLLMAFFANAPILNALYRRIRAGAGSSHLVSRSDMRSARNTDGIELCSAEDSREIDFMEAIRGGPEPEHEKLSSHTYALPASPAPARTASRSPNHSRRKEVPHTNVLLSVSRSKGTNRDSLGRAVQTVEIVQTSEPADPKNPMVINPLGGVGRVETKISHHDTSPLPSNPDIYDELYSSAHRSMTLEDMLAEPNSPGRKQR
ncbi:putative ubid family decarboxylase protein [Botrytis fragariae]|uniref:Putative ubid family decarboxylase protein n=1 Tax=Botrytis fragariae TaxID=1964551 RepID=A0A8H6EGF8_9HELO|nr:putative ubid family decarboxylase protein [Botrytis fragariae]KAF5871216.1 putative ubid family decarboxylase protein [Botrytis fragariae]